MGPDAPPNAPISARARTAASGNSPFSKASAASGNSFASTVAAAASRAARSAGVSNDSAASGSSSAWQFMLRSLRLRDRDRHFDRLPALEGGSDAAESAHRRALPQLDVELHGRMRLPALHERHRARERG